MNRRSIESRSRKWPILACLDSARDCLHRRSTGLTRQNINLTQLGDDLLGFVALYSPISKNGHRTNIRVGSLQGAQTSRANCDQDHESANSRSACPSMCY